MPWCPNCRSEYDEGIRTCYDCRCDLANELEPEEQCQHVREAYLLTAADEMEYKIIGSKLGEYGILVTKRYRGAGAVTQIYMGRTFGLDVYVPEVALPQAKEILDDPMDSDQNNKTGEYEELRIVSDFTKKGAWGKKILLICIIMVLAALGFLTMMYLVSFLHLL